MEGTAIRNQRISWSKKIKNNRQWFKDQANMLDTQHNTSNHGGFGYGNKTDYRKLKVNYDLFNNVIDLNEFQYVCQPFGEGGGKLPADMVNRDIVSGKIKTLLGMEMKRPFSFKVLAVNPEATTRREQEQMKRIREYVISQVMLPIRQEAEVKYMQEMEGRELSPEELDELNLRVEQETQAQTPEEVKKYMTREHQDPVEVMSQQLLNYKIKEQKVKQKFQKGFKHATLSAKEAYYVGILNDESILLNVNSLRFDYDKSPDIEFIEDGEWAVCEYPMTVSQVVSYFGSELTDKEIDELYEEYQHYQTNLRSTDFAFDFGDYEDDEHDQNSVRVLHCTWKSLRKIGFLDYYDTNRNIQTKFVDESYKLEKGKGDIRIEWHWIPESYETWKIGTDKYAYMRPIPGQFKDVNNLYNCKLPYYGAVYDDMNSVPTSIMDRIKTYQYYYNIIMYRIELLIASDKGKKIMMNINAIPSSSDMDIKKWQYFFESTSIGWFDPTEEGVTNGDVNAMAKVIDLSLVSDISKYIEIAEYLRKQCGDSIGVTSQMEGQIGAREAVSNTQQSLIQSSHILEPYFSMHDIVKGNVLDALLEATKIAYVNSGKTKLTYMLDDMSREIVNLDLALLDSNTTGVFIENGTKADEIMQYLRQLTHAAIQSQKAELSDIISLIKQDGIIDAEETLKVAETKRREHEAQMSQQAMKLQAEEAEKERAFKREEHKMNLEEIRVKEEERRKTELEKAALMGASFNPNLDNNNNGVNDFLEIQKHGIDTSIKQDKNKLDREKFEHQKKVDEQKLALENKKLKQNNQKKSEK